MSDNNNEDDLNRFRKSREESLKKEWLVVVGLSWLKRGERNTVGSSKTSTVPLPKAAPAELGRILLSGEGQTELILTTVHNVKIDGQPAVTGKRYRLKSDKDDSVPTVVSLGTVSFFIIDRTGGLAVRIRDTEAEALKQFKGLNWWPRSVEFRTVGQWQPLDPPKTLMIPDVTGHSQEEKIAGLVRFSLRGQTLQLYPTRKGNKLFFVFKDQTTGKGSYGTGRFLSAEVQSDGHVVMDFNRAINPPCARVHFATCPIAPSENRLAVAIEAGERAPTDEVSK